MKGGKGEKGVRKMLWEKVLWREDKEMGWDWEELFK